MKKKYSKIGDVSLGYKCTKRKCGWEGLDEDRIEKPTDNIWTELCCPKCGNNEFYGLIEKPNK